MHGQDILIGWPEGDDKELFDLVSRRMEQVEGFFDNRTLLGNYVFDEEKEAVYSLVFLKTDNQRTAIQ